MANYYQVSRQDDGWKCTCPDFSREKQCVHAVWAGMGLKPPPVPKSTPVPKAIAEVEPTPPETTPLSKKQAKKARKQARKQLAWTWLEPHPDRHVARTGGTVSLVRTHQRRCASGKVTTVAVHTRKRRVER